MDIGDTKYLLERVYQNGRVRDYGCPSRANKSTITHCIPFAIGLSHSQLPHIHGYRHQPNQSPSLGSNHDEGVNLADYLIFFFCFSINW